MSCEGSPGKRRSETPTPSRSLSRRIKVEATSTPGFDHITERVWWGLYTAGNDEDSTKMKEMVKQTAEFAITLRDMRTSAFETHETRWRRIIERLRSPEHERKAAVGAMKGFRFEDMPWPAFGILYYRKKGREEISVASIAMQEMLASDALGRWTLDDDDKVDRDIGKELSPDHFPLTREGIINFLDHPERKEIRKRIGMTMPYSASDLKGPNTPGTIVQAEQCRWRKIQDHTADLVHPGHLEAVNAALALVCALLARANSEEVAVLRGNLRKCSLSPKV